MSKRSIQAFAADLPVTSYLDYRDYLGELYARAKAATSPYSYLLFAEDLGFSQTNVIRLVVARKRTLAMKSAKTIVDSLDLRKEDRKYFLAMVQYANARSANLRHKFFREMLEVKQASVASDGDKRRMAYYSDWYHPVVREMTRLKGFNSDPAWVADQIYADVSTEKVRRSLELLESLGLVSIDAETGKVSPKDESPMLLPTDATAGELSIVQYHQTMIDLARQAVDQVPSKRREVNALTLSLSMAAFKELRKRIRAFCSEIMTLETEEQARECVAQVNVQLFTLTKPQDDDERGNE